MNKVELYIEGQKVDLFKDESIVIQRSVKNYKELDKIFSDYSQSFTIPASRNNNAIMRHWYNTDVDQTSNPAAKKSARIEINQAFFKKGFIKFESAKLKKGVVDSYSITFFTALSNLKQIFGDDVLTDLPHTNAVPYNTFESALENRIQSNRVLLPMISPVRNWTLNALPDTNTINYNGFAAEDNENKYLKFSPSVEANGNLNLLNSAIIYKSTDPNSQADFNSSVIVNDQTANWQIKIYDRSNNYNLEYSSIIGTGNGSNSATISRPVIGQKELVYEFININKVEFGIASLAILNNEPTIWIYEYVSNGALLYEFKPAIALSSIIENIESKYGLTFSTNFFNTSAFTNLFMWSNREKGIGNHYTSNWTQITSPDYENDPNNIWKNASSYLEITPSDGDVINQVEVGIEVKTSLNKNASFPNPDAKLLVEINTNSSITYEEYDLNEGNNYRVAVNLTRPATGIQRVKFYVKSSFPERFKWVVFSPSSFLEVILYKDNVEFDNDGSCVFHFFDTTYIDNVTGETKAVNGGLPKQKVNDFFGGLIKMFNLVIEPDEVDDTLFNIQTLDDWYASGNTLNLTKYVDTESVEVNTISLFNTIKFEYEPTDQIIGKNFRENNTDIGYGDLQTKLVDEFGDPLGTSTFEIKAPFSNPSWQRLTNSASDSSVAPFLSELLVCPMIDSELKATNDKPFIFYYAGQYDISANTAYSVRKFYTSTTSVANKYELYNLCFQFDTSDNSFTNSLNFGAEINPFTLTQGSAVSPNIYNTYWNDYITDLFDNKTRKTTFKAILPLNTMINLKVKDTIQIGLKTYRINNMSMNLITGETTFELLNLIS